MKMMSLPDEDDEPTWWRWWAYLMKIILETPYLMKIILETPYLMKIILETLRAHYIRYLGVYPQESDIYSCLSK